MNQPHIWWYITRASALIAWILMTFAVVWGILLSTRLMRKVDNVAWLQDLHRYLGGMSVIMVLLHMVSLMLDGWLHFSLPEVLVPLSSTYRTIPVALGVVAFYLLLAVQGSSLMMRWLPRRFWKGLHYASYISVLLVSFHAGLTGTDVTAWWYRSVAIALIALTALAIVVRIILSGGEDDTTAVPAPARLPATAATEGPALMISDGPRSAPRLETRRMVVTATMLLAEGVIGIRLVPHDREILPVWYPGAHIILHLPGGMESRYSLCGDPADRYHFDIAVLKTENSEGRSIWIHSHVVPGMELDVVGPLNHFELQPANQYLFIAGGIGITPIKAMIESLPERRDWSLTYFGRSRKTMAFVDELVQRYPNRVQVHARDEAPADLDLRQLIHPAAEVYCCGPESLMSEVASLVPPTRMHFERFIPLDRPAAAPQPIRVTCRKSSRDFVVAADQSILAALEDNGLPVLGSCRKGVCGACEVPVLQGIPEHLDSVMDDAEKDRLRVMYPCVSRARTAELVLDI